MMFPGERILEEAKPFSQNYLENIKMGDQIGALKAIEVEVINSFIRLQSI